MAIAHLGLPKLKKIRKVQLDEPADFLTFAGFEDRSLAFSRALEKESVRKAILVEYSPNQKNRIRESIVALRELVPNFLPKADRLVFSRYAPDEFPALLEARLREIECKRLLVDISAMSKFAICIVLEVCRRLNLGVTIFYAEAQEYSPSEGEFKKAHLANSIRRPSIQVYTGLEEVVSVGVLSSAAMQGQPISIVTFMSFNENFTQALLNRINPTRLFLLNGRPPKKSWREKATAWIHEELRSEWPDIDNPIRGKLPVRVSSTLDYRETVSELLKLYWQLCVDNRIIFAPTGSKMQALGMYLVRAIHPDVHIEYPTPKGFWKDYSTGIGAMWQLDLGSLGEKTSKWRAKDLSYRLGQSS